MNAIDSYTWAYWFVGFGLVLGGCYCCTLGCSYCTDGSDVATIEVVFGGIAADQDTTTCCTTLNKSYILAIDAAYLCHFSLTYENGICDTADCSDCDTFGCTIACEEGATTPCNPLADPGTSCSKFGSVTYDAHCTSCELTERATINFPASFSADQRCDCLCSATGLIWDTDVFLAAHPEVDWASPGDEVYYCNCSALDCTATVGRSSVALEAWITTSGSDARITLTGSILTHTLTGGKTFGSYPIACATEMNALALTIGASGSGSDVEVSTCNTSQCLCTIPTSCTATYIP
jgi:hypothetical protein